MNWFLKLKPVAWAYALFVKYESDAQMAHFGFGVWITLAFAVHHHLVAGVLWSAGFGFFKQFILEVWISAADTESYALKSTIAWFSGVALAVLISVL